MNLPFSTSELPGIGGVLRATPDDFVVEELPRYQPSGEGEHLFVEIEKRGLTTFAAIDRLARQLGVSPRDVGYAGMKDAQAVTRQWLSLPRVEAAAALAVQTPTLRVLRAERHGNKLRVGHLRGNRFTLTIREPNADAAGRATAILAALASRGVPNFYGEQRFGLRGDNARLGAALLRGDDDGLLRILLGGPREAVDPPAIFRARELFEGGDVAGALATWPGGMERSALRQLADGRSPRDVVRRLDRKVAKLWVNALQSAIFNAVVAGRIDSLDRVRAGDFAYLHDRGACFLVEDEAAEQVRADRFEISATGPMFGGRMSRPTGEAWTQELAALASFGLDERSLDNVRDAPGERRPIRVRLEHAEASEGEDDRGRFVRAAFSLPAGSYATVVAGELMKPDGVTTASCRGCS